MLNLIYQRLLGSAQFAAVEVAEDVEAIVGRATAAEDGSLFVVPFRERAGVQRYATGGHMQAVNVQFVVAMLFRQHDDPRGAERALRFDTVKSNVENLLAGWQPLSGGDVCSLVGGESSALANSVSVYLQTWQTSRFLIGCTA